MVVLILVVQQLILLYVPAHGNYLYSVYLTSVEDSGDTVFDYDSLESIINILKSAKKDWKRDMMSFFLLYVCDC